MDRGRKLNVSNCASNGRHLGKFYQRKARVDNNGSVNRDIWRRLEKNNAAVEFTVYENEQRRTDDRCGEPDQPGTPIDGGVLMTLHNVKTLTNGVSDNAVVEGCLEASHNLARDSSCMGSDIGA